MARWWNFELLDTLRQRRCFRQFTCCARSYAPCEALALHFWNRMALRYDYQIPYRFSRSRNEVFIILCAKLENGHFAPFHTSVPRPVKWTPQTLNALKGLTSLSIILLWSNLCITGLLVSYLMILDHLPYLLRFTCRRVHLGFAAGTISTAHLIVWPPTTLHLLDYITEQKFTSGNFYFSRCRCSKLTFKTYNFGWGLALKAGTNLIAPEAPPPSYILVFGTELNNVMVELYTKEGGVITTRALDRLPP